MKSILMKNGRRSQKEKTVMTRTIGVMRARFACFDYKEYLFYELTFASTVKFYWFILQIFFS